MTSSSLHCYALLILSVLLQSRALAYYITAGADHCGHSDVYCSCKVNWHPRSITHCISFYPWLSNAYPQLTAIPCHLCLTPMQATIQSSTHNRSGTSTSTTLSRSLLKCFLSICTSCHSLHSATSLDYRLTLTKSFRQVANYVYSHY